MYKFILSTFFLGLLFFHSSGQFNHGGRGMYVNKFFRLAKNTSGATVINQVNSILSIPAKEDSLLEYAKENHFTYLILYDLYYVFGNATYENYLCSFIQKAKTQYCIEYIGVASSCSGLFDDIFTVAGTPPITFTEPEFIGKYNTALQSNLSLVSASYNPNDSLFLISEATKLDMRAMIFNDACAYKIDVLVSEYEFWNTAVDDCVGDNPTKDVRYTRYQTLINNMDVVRDNYIASHPSHKVYTETYIGYLNQNTAYAHQTIADWMDGSYSGKRRADRINPHYYGTDPSKLYSRTTAGINNSGYYMTRFLDFAQGTTTNQTNLHPIFSSEYVPWGAGASFLGGWFSQGVNNNIFTAEKYFYNDWYDDAQNYHQSTVGSPTLGNVVQPGGVVWFTSGQLVSHVENPLLFTSNSPVCVAAGQNGTFQFQYQGPIEQGVSFKFYITNAGTTTVRCGTTNSIAWPSYNPATQTSIDLNAALGGCSLPAGDYDAHLELTYASGCSAYIAPVSRISVVNAGKIVALTSTTVCQGNPVYLQANSTGGGTTTYAWYDGSTAISGATSSTYAPNASSTGNHNYSCLITSSVGACSANRSNVIPVTINTYPSASISLQSSSSCSVTLQASPAGGSYIWHDGSTGSTYTTGYSGTYTVSVSVNGCKSISSSFTVSSLSGTGTVTPSVSISANTGSTICTGTTVDFTATPVNGGSAPVYQWKKNGNNVGTNSNTYTNNTLANNEVISCVMTSNLSCASPLTATSNNITMTVNPNVATWVSISASTGNVICSGTNVTFTATPTNGGATPSYQWKKNGISVGTNSNTYSDNTISNADVINCTMATSAACAIPASITSSNIIMTVYLIVAPSISISSSPGNTICSGTSVTFTAVTTNGGSAPVFQWKKNGINVGTNSNSYSTSSLLNSDVISCVLTSNFTCVTPVSVSSNTITMTVNTQVSPSVSISTNTANPVCPGTNVTFTATPVNGGTSPSYQWKKNGINIGVNLYTYSDNGLSDNDIITCSMTSNAVCVSPSIATSNNITISLGTIVTPSVSITANPGNSICSGTNVLFTALPVNGGATPVFQWKKNGVNTGTNSSTYSSNALINNDVITCVMTSSSNCALPANVTSNSVTMNVIAIVTPSVSINSNFGNNICSGSNVTFTAIAINGGPAPFYQWKRNSVNTGTNSNTYSDNALANNDLITCILTSNASCVSPANATSNSITMSVVPSVTPVITISSNLGNTICSGNYVTFSAATTNSGISPVFQWKKNGINVGTNSNLYSDATLLNNDLISCVMTCSTTCAISNVVSSNNITLLVNPYVSPSISISSNAGSSICAGTNVTFTAVAVHGGTAPVYQWMKNGINTGTNSNTYSDNSIADNDVISCALTSNIPCASPATANSNSIRFTVSTFVIPSVTISSNSDDTICAGSNVIFTALPVNGGNSPTFNWKKNGNTVGTNSNTYSDNTLSNNDQIFCEMSSSSTCAAFSSVTSNTFQITISPCSPLSLNLKLFIQGYYRGDSAMAAVADPQINPLVCDTVIIELHKSTFPYYLASVSTDVIDIYGSGTFEFPAIIYNQGYYIVIRHRNSLDTWSKIPLLINAAFISYDFTVAANTAYGDNLADLNDGKFAIWSGDVSDGTSSGKQDGIINDLDRIEIENAIELFITGYNIYDLTGDHIVESVDFSLIENNKGKTISIIRP